MYRYVLVMIDEFIKFGWTVAFRNKYAQTIKDCFETNFKTSKRRPGLLETDHDKKIPRNFFTGLLNKSNINRYSRYTSLEAGFPETFNRTIRDLLENIVFEKFQSNWLNVSPKITKH